MVCPSTQPFGSGFGQNGSTSNFGACSPAASTTVRFPSHADPAPSATASVITPVPIHTFLFIADLALLDDRPPWSEEFSVDSTSFFRHVHCRKNAFSRKLPESSLFVPRGRR